VEFIIYVYSSQLPAVEMKYLRCPHCGRIIFKVNSTRILLSNAYGASFTELEPHSSYIMYKCHSCKSEYRILFQ
jgi:DNA-directed RNA polymerase subunit RPC12/RpoP